MQLTWLNGTINPINIIHFFIGYSGLMIYFAWDDNFNMQVLFPIVCIVIGFFCFKNNFHVYKNDDFKYFFFLCLSYWVSLASGFILNNEAIDELAIIRTFYSCLLILYYVIVINFDVNKNLVKILIKGNLFSGSFASILVIKNWLSGASGKVSLLNYWGNSVEENYTAAFIAFSVVLCVLVFFTSNKKKPKVVSMFLATVNTLAVFLTGSRAAFLALLISLFILLFIYFFDSKIVVYKKILMISFGVLISVYFFVNIIEILPEFTYNRLFLNSLDDSSNRERIALWSLALENFLYRPLFGYGAGVFSYYVHKEYSHHIVVVAHNTFLDFLVDFGIIGFFFLGLLFYRNICICFKKNGVCLIPLLICWFMTSAIVGGERAFFFWNGLIMISILSKYLKENKGGLTNLWEK